MIYWRQFPSPPDRSSALHTQRYCLSNTFPQTTELADFTAGETMTQRLTELNEANAAGLLSPEEYEKTRAAIIGLSQQGAAAADDEVIRTRTRTHMSSCE